MSESQIKPIIINPELFKISPRSVKNKTLKKRPSISRTMQPNKLKTDLLAKIKNYKHNKLNKNENDANTNDANANNVNLNPDYNANNTNLNSDYNGNIANGNKDLNINKSNVVPVIKAPKNSTTLDINKTEPVDEFTASINFLKDLSSRKKKKPINNPALPISLDNIPDLSKSSDNSENLETLGPGLSPEPPQYSCLKNGSLPTYREWKNKTIKKPNVELDEQDEQDEQNEQDERNNPDENSIYPKNKSKTITYKYYLGKRGKKISVLVKDSQTRKKISREHNLIKQTNVHDMRNYLKRHNLLKSGSHAPADVIKKIYEQALLSGDIRNYNKDNLIHNYLNES